MKTRLGLADREGQHENAAFGLYPMALFGRTVLQEGSSALLAVEYYPAAPGDHLADGAQGFRHLLHDEEIQCLVGSFLEAASKDPTAIRD